LKAGWFYINFLETLPDPKMIEEHIYKSIIRQFERKYLDRFRAELERIDGCALQPNYKTIVVLFALMMRAGYTVSIVLDNADQHEYRQPKYQEDVIAVAKYLTESLKIITIVSLREENFFKSTRSGVLTAFPLPPLHISAPKFEDLIRARIDYALMLLQKTDEELSEIIGRDVRLGDKKELLRVFFEIVRNSLRSTRFKGREILMFIDDASGRDMRQALSFFRTFMVSGNTNVNEMLEVEAEADRRRDHYEIPLHHVIRSIILHNSLLYSTKTSPIFNLFNFNANFSDSHFLYLHILDYLNNRRSYNSIYGDGYVDIDSIIQESEQVGISRAAMDEAFVQMADFGLVDFENQSKHGYDSAHFVKITSTGMYYLKYLVYIFQYLDLVWMDTPISDATVVQLLLRHVVELHRQKLETDILERFERTELFLNYLLQSEVNEHRGKPEYEFSELTKRVFMPDILKAYEDNKSYILSRGIKPRNHSGIEQNQAGIEELF
jgi:hypothetical protein